MSGTLDTHRYRVLWSAFLLLLLALALRLLFLYSLPDHGAASNPYYSGDTPTWLAYATAIQSGEPFDLGLPLRPPGIAYLTAWLWDGQADGLLQLKLAWVLMGAATVALMFTALLREFGIVVAVIAAIIAAASTGLIVLSTSLNNETPYLLLVISSFVLWQSVRHRPRWHTLLAWSTLHGLACLIRVEHVLFFFLVSAYLLWFWSRQSGPRDWRTGLRRIALSALFFALPLLPWQWHAVSQVRHFNRQALPMPAAVEQLYQQLESVLAEMRWTDEARRERDALPAFCRRSLGNFVAATVALRGGYEVSGADFEIIEEAFGAYPESLQDYPFIALYGGLNFYLANNPAADGGFTRAPLEVPPPLAGGPSRYPGFLITGLPPPDLTFSYPPHLEILNHGYRMGWRWILSHPGDYVALALRKLRLFWSGTTLGFTGYNAPLGMSGIRHAVDVVAPEAGAVVVLWRVVGLAVLLLGIWIARHEAAIVPWLLLLTTKTLTTLAFFGYAREGAVLIPVFALSLALLAARGLSPQSPPAGDARRPATILPWFRMCLALALILIAIEGYRSYSAPAVRLDGRLVGTASPFPEPDYEVRRLEVE
jgi:hypothetical protein